MTACAGNNTVAALIAGSIDAAAAQRLEHHLDQCVTCRELVADLGRGLSAIGDGTRAAGSADRLPRAGEQLGRYTIRRVIGVGGMGVVYEAHDPTLDRRVAMKLLRPDLVDDALSADQLLAEAQAMARLQHPNVAVVHDVGLVQGQLYVCMEYVDGQTLRDWLGEQPRSWREVLDMFLAAGRGLAYVHAAGLVHLDFKPDNVLLGHGGRVLISDFGLARVVGRSDRLPYGTGVAVGTPAYMAPEQRRGERTDARSDQFGFCASLVEAFGGSHARGDVRAPVPAQVQRALARGLAARPSDRFPSMAALLAALDRARTVRGSRRAIAMVVVAALAVTAAVATRPGDTVTRFVDRPVVERVLETRTAPALAVERDELPPAAEVTGHGAPAAIAGTAVHRDVVVTAEARHAALTSGDATLAVFEPARQPEAHRVVATTHFDHDATGSLGGGFLHPTGQLTPVGGSPAAPGCNDGTVQSCSVREPTCPPTTVAAIRDACWTCTDATTCAPLGLPEVCDDGAPLSCGKPPPGCPGHEVAAIHDGCWKCADPFTCNQPPPPPPHPIPNTHCGNGFCEAGEDHGSCPADCCELDLAGSGGCAARCGNGFCEQGEDHGSCPMDCCEVSADGACVAVCGNGFCEPGETPASCAADCH